MVAPVPTRAEASRARLLDAALESFASKGFHATTTRDIAAAAGMSPAAVYVHHRSKEELLFQLCREGHQVILDAIRATASDVEAPTARLQTLTRTFADYHVRNRTRARVVNYERGALTPDHAQAIVDIRMGIEHEFRAVVEAGQASGEFDVTNTGLTTTAILSLGIDISRWYRESGAWDAEEISNQYADLALRLVGATAPC